MPLCPILAQAPFEKWGLDFIGPISPPARRTNARYILIAIDFLTKWTEAKVMKTCDVQSTTRFLYKMIIIRFSCPLEIVSDQGNNFLNETIKQLMQEFLVQHSKSFHITQERTAR